MNILILDGTPTLLHYYKAILSPLKSVGSVATASDANEFMKALYARKPSIIIADIDVHPINGKEILRQFKALMGDIPVVTMSIYEDNEDLIRESFDIVTHITKPVKAAHLLELFGND